MSMNVKKNDTVLVLSGKDKGKQGKPRRQGEEGGIISKETPIYACKVMTVCPKCNKATRPAHKVEGGKKVRVCKHCGAEL